MKKILLFTLLLYCSFINAQISFEKGYFISNDGQRTECFIKNLDWKNTPKDFKYKTDPSEKEFKTENIANIQEFGITNESTYKKFKIKIDRSSNELKKMLTNKEPIWSEEVIFLKVLVKGDATLYSFSDESITRYFYETKTIPTEQLINVKYIESDNNEGAEKVIESNEYKTQLFKNVKSDNITENDIARLTYKKADLVKYFNKYNNAVNPNAAPKAEENTTKGAFHIKIAPAVSFVSLSANNTGNSNFNVDFDSKVIFKIGFEAEYVLPYNKNKWSVFTNPSYQKYENEKIYLVPTGFVSIPDKEYKASANYNTIQVPLGIRHYMFLNENSKLFINAAYVIDLGSKASITYTDVATNTVTEFKSNTGANFAFGLGYNFKNKFSGELRLNTKKQLMRDYLNYSTNYSSVDFVLAYTIF
ncbi:tRNA modification GTPase [Flavobacterium sp. LC2016-01]|uniref:tRNA modification GTPase n=1 Tax=Flavobacterium sp. LC2016-01 TaxID=2675876 RepID=UPI0012BAAE7A|nr:tRNA modification GTPase [Flavobacterium sp. LC2016-01]MTH16946.1 tRNA modification GTPase [Flavobacterium sp. LC2016-01]